MFTRIFMYSCLAAIFLPLALAAESGTRKPEIKLQLGHPGDINAVVFMPGGEFALSGSMDGMLILWDVARGKEVRAFRGQADAVQALAVSPDGKYAIAGGIRLTSGDERREIYLWEIATGKKVRTLNIKPFTSIVAMAFSPDGKTLLQFLSNGTVSIWDVSTGKQTRSYSSNLSATITSAVFSPDRKFILTCQKDKTLRLLDAETGKELRAFAGHTEDISTAAFSPDGRLAVSGSGNLQNAAAKNEVKVWDVETGKELRTLSGHRQQVTSVAFSPDGQSIASADAEGTVTFWEASTGKKIRSQEEWVPFRSIAFSPDGKYLLAGLMYKAMILWETETGREVQVIARHTGSVLALAASADGKYALSASNDGTVKLWDIADGKELGAFSGHTRVVTSVAFSPNGKYALSGSADKTMKLWQLPFGKELRTFSGHSNAVMSVAFSPDGKFVVSGSADNTIKLWNTATGSLVRTFTGHTQMVNAIAVSPDGKFILSGSSDKTMKLWDLATGTEVRTFPGHSSVPKAVAFSSDGAYALSGSDYAVNLWKISDGTLLRVSQDHKNFVSSTSISPDGKLGASASWDETIKLWDLTADVPALKTFDAHLGVVNAVTFLPDGKHLLSGSADGTMRLWNLETGAWTAFMANIGGSQWLVFNSDGYWDASPNGGELVAMVRDMDCWNIDQFAVMNNRPDKILEKLPGSESEQITHYAAQYKKRLKRLGLKEEDLAQDDYHVPDAKITEASRHGKRVDLAFTLSDSKYELKQYHVFVNDVPLFGAQGKPAEGSSLEMKESIELGAGDNKIEISCMNTQGAESYRAFVYQNFQSHAEHDLYLLAFGVSKYKNPSYNLQYADKDAVDLGRIVEGFKGKGFANVYTKVITNEQVTPEAIRNAKQFLKDSRPDDTFILFIAGHGMHSLDNEGRYYYLTSNADVDDLAGTAADFESIEDLLQGVEPRNKLFLMDACESGELDEEGTAAAPVAAAGAGFVSRGFKKTQSDKAVVAQLKRTSLYQKDRYIYNDLLRRSGAIVFSSSKGGELSYERSDIQNGLFTHSIITALTTAAADKNKDGIVSTDELREYVNRDVSTASGGMQHPTVDRDNIYQKFGFPVK